MDSDNQVKYLLYPILHGISGAFAADISTIILYPFDSLAIRMQIGNGDICESPRNHKSKKVVEKKDDDVSYDFSKFRKLARQVYEKEGIKGFYKGLLSMLCINHFSYGTFFLWFYHFMQARLGFFRTVSIILLESGWMGFFKGLLPSLILIFNPMIQYTLYEFIKRKYKISNKNPFLIILTAAFTKAISILLTYPYLVIRANMHVSNLNKMNENSILRIIKEVYKKHGVKGFYVGIKPKMMQTVLNSSILLLLYEKVIKILKGLTYLIVKYVLINYIPEKELYDLFYKKFE